MNKARRYSGKMKVELWIMQHLDGNRYSTKQIADECRVSPAVARGAINYLREVNQIFVNKTGRGKGTRWQFWPYLDPDGENDGPSALKELLII